MSLIIYLINRVLSSDNTFSLSFFLFLFLLSRISESEKVRRWKGVWWIVESESRRWNG
jgi:hypothetical protein